MWFRLAGVQARGTGFRVVAPIWCSWSETCTCSTGGPQWAPGVKHLDVLHCMIWGNSGPLHSHTETAIEDVRQTRSCWSEKCRFYPPGSLWAPADDVWANSSTVVELWECRCCSNSSPSKHAQHKHCQHLREGLVRQEARHGRCPKECRCSHVRGFGSWVVFEVLTD